MYLDVLYLDLDGHSDIYLDVFYHDLSIFVQCRRSLRPDSVQGLLTLLAGPVLGQEDPQHHRNPAGLLIDRGLEEAQGIRMAPLDCTHELHMRDNRVSGLAAIGVAGATAAATAVATSAASSAAVAATAAAAKLLLF